MNISFQITYETAALVWGDHYRPGKTKPQVAEFIAHLAKSYVENEAALYKSGTPAAAARDFDAFKNLPITDSPLHGNSLAIANGLLHAADDYPCCKATLHAAANIIIQMEHALHELSQPLSRSDYTVAKLDEIVRGIAINALIVTS